MKRLCVKRPLITGKTRERVYWWGLLNIHPPTSSLFPFSAPRRDDVWELEHEFIIYFLPMHFPIQNEWHFFSYCKALFAHEIRPLGKQGGAGCVYVRVVRVWQSGIQNILPPPKL
jgi:hypothetical protein